MLNLFERDYFMPLSFTYVTFNAKLKLLLIEDILLYLVLYFYLIRRDLYICVDYGVQ